MTGVLIKRGDLKIETDTEREDDVKRSYKDGHLQIKVAKKRSFPQSPRKKPTPLTPCSLLLTSRTVRQPPERFSELLAKAKSRVPPTHRGPVAF